MLAQHPGTISELPKGVPKCSYGNGIGAQIACRENYDTLLELEKMGGKIRDTDDQFIGVEGRDDKTKFLISPRMNPFHDTNVVIRVWGTTFKPALKRECERLGVKICDRVMATSLLTQNGIQGSRVVGATGVNARAGELSRRERLRAVHGLRRRTRCCCALTGSATTATMRAKSTLVFAREVGNSITTTSNSDPFRGS